MSDLQNESEYMTIAKILIPTVVISITLLIPRWYWCEQCYQQAAAHNHHTNRTKGATVGNVEANRPAHQEEAGYESSDSENEPNETPWYDRPWLIAVIAVAYTIFAALQWLAIKDQGERAADNLTRLERAWILVRPIDSRGELPFHTTGGWARPNVGGPVFFTSEEILKEDYKFHLGYTVKHYGRSPGRMVHHWCNLVFAETEGGMPNKPDYKTGIVFDQPETRLMEPRNSFKTWVPIYLKDLINMVRKRKFLYIYGYITYLDVWGKDHTTRFGFYYLMPGSFDPNAQGFYPEPRSYNEET